MTTLARIEPLALSGTATTAAIPYDLRVGVTGHRTIADEPAVAQAMRALIRRIANALAQSSAVPVRWTVVSPLATGADQIVAETVLEQPGAMLEVLLPFALEEYRNDFERPADRDRFESLRARAKAVHRLSGPFGEERDAESAESSRNLAYLRLGQQVVDASEIVIAIWNGQRPNGLGGTADVVRYALEHGRSILWIHRDHPEQEARVIRGVRTLAGGALEVDAVPFEEASESVSRGYSQQLAYCTDRGVSDAALARETEKESRRLAGIAAQSGVTAEELRPLLAVLPHFVRADLLARVHQSHYLRATKWVMRLAAGAVAIAVAQVLFFPNVHEVIALELLAMAAALALWKSSHMAGWHTKWLHDRYLAERLRVTMFTALVERPPGMSLDGELPFYPGPQHWLRGVVEELAQFADSLRPAVSPERYKEFLLRAWLDEQHRFQQKTAHQVEHRTHLRHLAGKILFVITFLAAALHFMHIPHYGEHDPNGLHRIDHWITWLALILPVCAGGVHAVTSQLELDRVAVRSRRMTRSLASHIATIRCADTPADVRRTVREAARLMTSEAHEWWVLLSFQNVQLHV